MKLKTLKDISEEINKDGIKDMVEGENWNSTRDIQLTNKLKQEAIKWIKELNRVNNSHTLDLCEFTAHGSDSKTNSNVIKWIKKFFNI